MLVNTCTNGGSPLFHSCNDGTLTGKCCPQCPSVISLNRGKKEGAKSGCSVVCGRTVSWFCNFAIGIPHHNIMYSTGI